MYVRICIRDGHAYMHMYIRMYVAILLSFAKLKIAILVHMHRVMWRTTSCGLPRLLSYWHIRYINQAVSSVYACRQCKCVWYMIIWLCKVTGHFVQSFF